MSDQVYLQKLDLSSIRARLPKELASVSPFDYRDLLSEILSHKLEIERIVVDRIFSDSEEAAAVIKAFSRAAIQLNLPQVVSVLGQTEALGMTHPDILDTVPDAKPVLKRIVQVKIVLLSLKPRLKIS